MCEYYLHDLLRTLWCNYDSSAKYSKKWHNMIIITTKIDENDCLSIFKLVYFKEFTKQIMLYQRHSFFAKTKSNRWQLTFPSPSFFGFFYFAFTAYNVPNCRFSMTIIFRYNDRILDSLLIPENTVTKNPYAGIF